MSDEKEIKLPIDTSLGKLPQKTKGSIVPIECKTMEEIRRHQLERLAAGFRMFSHFGYDEGIAGHITLRDPEYPHYFWVNPFGMHFGQICISDLILVDRDGTAAINWGAYGVPESFLVYENKVIKKYIGPINEQILIEIERIIK